MSSSGTDNTKLSKDNMPDTVEELQDLMSKLLEIRKNFPSEDERQRRRQQFYGPVGGMEIDSNSFSSLEDVISSTEKLIQKKAQEKRKNDGRETNFDKMLESKKTNFDKMLESKSKRRIKIKNRRNNFKPIGAKSVRVLDKRNRKDSNDSNDSNNSSDEELKFILKKRKEEEGGGRRTRRKKRSKSRAKSRKKRRRKRGGTRKNAGPEKPIVGYNYIINIYHGGQGEKVLRYRNVIGTYMGLASEFHDGFDSVEGKKYMFKTRVLDEEDGNDEFIGEIVSLIGPPHINVDGGRRKKRTKKRRKSKGRKRRRKNRKKRTKRRR